MNSRIARKLLAAVGALILALAVAGTATAQKKKGGVIRLDETVIEGRVQKPNAFFINTRQALVYEVMELKESFVDEIPRVVEDGNF